MSTHRENLAQALKRARIDAGFRSQGDLAKALHIDRSAITKAESPSQALPTPDLVASWADQTGANPDELTELLQRCKSGTPDWFMSYLDAESKATLIRLWDTVHFPGLVQTEAYARAVLSRYPHPPERLAALVEQRMTRQEVIGQAQVIAVLDHRAFRDCIGSPEIMAEQCCRVASLAEDCKLRLHVVPEGANVGLSGAFAIASRATAVTVDLYTAVRDIPSTAPDVIDAAMDLFELVLAAALPIDQSIDYARTWEATWKERA